MNRLEKIAKCIQQKTDDDIQRRSGNSEEARLLKERQRAVFTALNIKEQLEEIKDTVWGMGTVFVDDEKGTMSLIASWPAEVRGPDDESNEKYPKSTYIIGDNKQKISVSVRKVEANDNKMAVEVNYSKVEIAFPVDQKGSDDVDNLLTEACLESCGGKPLSEKATVDFQNLIKSIRSGRIKRERVTFEYQKYLP